MMNTNSPDFPTAQTLSQSPVFKGIPPQEIQRLLTLVPHAVKKFHKGQTIAYRGDTCDKLLILLTGSIRGEMLDFNGKIVEVETMHAPSPIAAAFLFGRKNLFPVDAVAIEDVFLLSIPKDSLLQLMQMNPILLTNYLDVVSNRTHFLTERLWFMSFKTIRQKIAHYLLKLAAPDQNKVFLPKKQEELSQFFGVSRPSLSRVIGELEKEKIITCQRRQVIILDREKLKALVD